MPRLINVADGSPELAQERPPEKTRLKGYNLLFEIKARSPVKLVAVAGPEFW
jgi:hypothetical protein